MPDLYQAVPPFGKIGRLSVIRRNMILSQFNVGMRLKDRYSVISNLDPI